MAERVLTQRFLVRLELLHKFPDLRVLIHKFPDLLAELVMSQRLRASLEKLVPASLENLE